MSVSVQDNIDVFFQKLPGFRWNVLEAKLQSGPGKIDDQGPLEIAVAITPNDCDRRPNGSQFIQDPFGTDIAQMPNLVSVGSEIENWQGQFVMRIGDHQNFHKRSSSGF